MPDTETMKMITYAPNNTVGVDILYLFGNLSIFFYSFVPAGAIDQYQNR